MSDVAGVIVAAGSGRRFGGDLPKIFVDLGGSPLFVWALRAYDRCPLVTRNLIAVGAEFVALAEDACAEAGLGKPWRVIVGGDRRQDTVVRCLEELAASETEIVAVHDGARPLIDDETICRSVRFAREMGACVTAAPMTDTLKRADDDGIVMLDVSDPASPVLQAELKLYENVNRIAAWYDPDSRYYYAYSLSGVWIFFNDEITLDQLLIVRIR